MQLILQIDKLRVTDMRDEAGVIGGWLVVAGAVGVVLISGIYASAPTDASAPLPAGTPMATALAATTASVGRLWLAGSMGFVADILLIGGCFVLMLREGEPVLKRLLWLWLALSTAIFFAVDGLASQVIPQLAVVTGDDLSAFTLARKSYDAAFALGVGTFGLAFMAAFLARESWGVVLRYLSLAVGAISLIAFGLHLWGVTVPLLMGISVGLVGILGAAMGYLETRSIARGTAYAAT